MLYAIMARKEIRGNFSRWWVRSDITDLDLLNLCCVRIRYITWSLLFLGFRCYKIQEIKIDRIKIF